ncbi:FkbM family methyltransferase [Octadecabacter ascidiaceicola]|uniref:31-O-demethyl-FK506 methyltransferase FkbM n=1 Tax=Octadecabacter ascidiaceicola TaxID=1655543 RepID=A0A238K6D8_9RHOB|nr:FkbM family methyltransferase [Octadecabacter ascidiaceicola]SMX37516.1 31-O-demethyl-FK506 methyltransferase FkbM [Octadecabacter ascidiaceicola]
MADTQKPTVAELEKQIGGLKRRVKRQRMVGYYNGLLDGYLLSLGPDDIIVDCGANVGEISARMAASGAQVHAFEPDPWTFERLERSTKDLDNVTCIQAGVGAEAGEFTLYRSSDWDDRPKRASVASSIVADMRDVDDSAEGISVSVIDLPAWLEEKIAEGHRIGLVKIDIEGAELDLMEAIMDKGLPHKIGLILVETHEKQLPQEADRFAALRERAKDFPEGSINLDWI